MSQTALDRLHRAFRVGPTPRRVAEDAARHYGVEGDPSHGRIVAYVRHHYTNYERVLNRIPHSQIDCFEFKSWVNGQIEESLAAKIAQD